MHFGFIADANGTMTSIAPQYGMAETFHRTVVKTGVRPWKTLEFSGFQVRGSNGIQWISVGKRSMRAAIEVHQNPTSATVLRLNMPLKRLHCSLKALFGPDQIDFSRLFTSITHLEIFDVPTNIDEEVWSALTRLPHLTHLTFNNDDYLPLCLTLLQTWEALQALVVLVYDRDGGLPEVDDDLAQHPRFVLMVCQWYLEDWMRGAHTGDDYWSRADNFIAKPLEYFLDPEDEVDSEDD
ncbi:hypothetical protein B0H19DRAFT_1063521 [Mycena capillaripes]|nr:hypothetical protein B0H19DRAFT_1063521 [Mycena capillaripes]